MLFFIEQNVASRKFSKSNVEIGKSIVMIKIHSPSDRQSRLKQGRNILL